MHFPKSLLLFCASKTLRRCPYYSRPSEPRLPPHRRNYFLPRNTEKEVYDQSFIRCTSSIRFTTKQMGLSKGKSALNGPLNLWSLEPLYTPGVLQNTAPFNSMELIGIPASAADAYYQTSLSASQTSHCTEGGYSLFNQYSDPCY